MKKLKSVFLGALLFLGVSCAKLPSGGSETLDESNNRDDLTTVLKQWECPKDFELKVSLLEVNPLQRLKTYQNSIKGLETLMASSPELKLNFDSLSFNPSVCTYKESTGLLKATVQIRKRVLDQFDEDGPLFAEALFLSLRFLTPDQSDFRAVIQIAVDQEGAPMRLLNTSNNGSRTLMTKIPSESSQVRIGKYKMSL
jgi:hypothetical protein